LLPHCGGVREIRDLASSLERTQVDISRNIFSRVARESSERTRRESAWV